MHDTIERATTGQKSGATLGFHEVGDHGDMAFAGKLPSDRGKSDFVTSGCHDDCPALSTGYRDRPPES